MAKVKSDTSFNRVQFDTFRVEAGLIQQNVKTAEKFGHSSTSEATKSITDNLITLSQALAYKRGNNTFYI